MRTDTKPRIRISSLGGPEQKLTLECVTSENREIIEGALNGVNWIRVVDGELQSHKIYKEFDNPIEDTQMHPFWSKPEQATLFRSEELTYTSKKFIEPESSLPTIYVSHICGYGYTPENYKRNAELLKSFGFIQMRSARLHDGTFWEHWMLQSWNKEGLLKVHLLEPSEKSKKGNDYVDSVKNFLVKHRVQFGSMNTSTQRWALSSPD